ncbi:uncharacterized protein LOC114129096 isoform X2 [Aphis gossypii]|nr:uncharacterized protein LOC114129096 isoform X2 [Aphis gossypii]XP_050063384.1 uncharacterized protein LOC114129096 isoform X2 [Aphis gossypii]
MSCPAKVSIKVKKTTTDTIKKDKYVKEGLVAEIHIFFQHSHTINTAEALGNLRSSEDTRQLFECYFSDGYGITEAIMYHEGKLELEGNEIAIANASLNPKYRTVQHWHDTWRQNNLGPRIGIGVVEKLKSKMSSYENNGIKVIINEDPFSVVIFTPLMQRAHTLAYSKDIVFVDSTASCDAHNHSITFMLTPCAVGAVPLAVIITKGQSFIDYENGFKLAQKCFGINGFGGQQFPKIFITDDSKAEREALKVVWPQSKQLLCRFHVSQSIWRWLWNSENNIDKSDRPILYNYFSKILTAPTAEMAMSAYLIAIDISNEYVLKYPNWVNYLNSYWSRKEIWCLSFRNYETHGHQTNNFSEVCVRIYKDIVLSRNKAYNVISLIDFTCTVMEQYYIRRIRKFCNGRCNVARLFLNTIKRKIGYLAVENIKSLDNNIFYVPSEKTGEMYEVNISLGCCTCEQGRLGSFCKHQGAVYFFYGHKLPNMPPVTPESRHSMAILAFGENALPISFYAALEYHPCNDLNENENTSNSNEYQNIQKNSPSFNTNDISHNRDSEDKINSPTSATKFKEIIDLMTEHHNKFGSSTDALNTYLKKLTNVKTRTSWETFLSTKGKQIPLRHVSKAKIHVQPTSISRRRLEVTRGSKRLAVGRPPSNEKVKKNKRQRCLQMNVKMNQPNAKSHGTSH